MAINIARFYQREQWKLDCEIITPMFLGNANQEAELRSAPFKGLLRYWWRVANGLRFADHKDLLKAESEIFGSPDEDGGKSRVTVEVTPLSPMTARSNNFTNPGDIPHPECERTQRKTNPLNYLAGMGLIKNGIQHSYFPPKEHFELRIGACQQVAEDVQSALSLLHAFGAIGSRSRNGWGSFCWSNPQRGISATARNFTEALDRDYPHCLGKDSTGPLFWKTKALQGTWEKCMKDLAETYVAIRAGDTTRSIPRLEVKAGSLPDRHLLGYPVTNHSLKKWDDKGHHRHSSALRLIVRKEGDGHRGYILHLPHLFSEKMWEGPDRKKRQIKIWQQVHSSLDQLCTRVALEEARS